MRYAIILCFLVGCSSQQEVEVPNEIRLSPGRITPRDMTDRQWDSYAAQARAEFIKNGQTAYDTGTGYFLGDDNGTPKFSIGNSAGNKLTWNGTTLGIVGTVTATAGTIGGWTLASTYLESGSGATTVRLDSAGTNPAISAGSATPASAPFRVTQGGALTATSATITGSVTATSGAIGGWTLASSYLESGAGATLTRIDSGGTNPAFSAGSATPASAPFRVTQGGALTATSATITGAITATSGSFTGGVTVGSGGSLSSGQSAYDTGTGYWLEYNSGTPRFSIGNASGNKLTWNGSTLAVTGSLSFTNSVQTFTPTWTGFSASPSGDLSYLDFGAYVILWNDTGGQIVGTSNSTAMTISNLPAGITPSNDIIGPTIAIDQGGALSGQFSVLSGGTLGFALSSVTGGLIASGGANFTNSGNKGLPTGWLIVYAK